MYVKFKPNKGEEVFDFINQYLIKYGKDGDWYYMECWEDPFNNAVIIYKDEELYKIFMGNLTLGKLLIKSKK